ncbi:hypothetical protein [Paracoccus sp. S1E-3]|nr:hypothetical protein [Paracoccus sp. S1E-3]MBA4489644.1 hypothetical protein [Paracoccus sp. S1E-3]
MSSFTLSVIYLQRLPICRSLQLQTGHPGRALNLLGALMKGTFDAHPL